MQSSAQLLPDFIMVNYRMVRAVIQELQQREASQLWLRPSIGNQHSVVSPAQQPSHTPSQRGHTTKLKAGSFYSAVKKYLPLGNSPA